MFMFTLDFIVSYRQMIHLKRSLIVCPAKLPYLNFHPLEVVARYRDPQQVGENYSLMV